MCNVPLWQMQDNVLANPWQSEKKDPVDISSQTATIGVPGFQGAEPSGKFRNSPKAGSGA